jgi:hypothetical protein
MIDMTYYLGTKIIEDYQEPESGDRHSGGGHPADHHAMDHHHRGPGGAHRSDPGRIWLLLFFILTLGRGEGGFGGGRSGAGAAGGGSRPSTPSYGLFSFQQPLTNLLIISQKVSCDRCLQVQEIEAKWQERWYAARINEVENDGRPKFMLIFAYPGVTGYLHVGQMRGFTYVDAIARFKRLEGYNVMFRWAPTPPERRAKPGRPDRRRDQRTIDYLCGNTCPVEMLDE